MARHRYAVCNVFTDQRFGGNPLAVVLDAAGIDDATMQAIARDFNLSETTFVLPPMQPGNTAQVRIFTPGGELPFAGHPTIGTAFMLATLGAIEPHIERIVFEEAIGPIPVRIARDPGSRRVIGCTLTAAVTPQRLAAGSEPALDAAAVAGLLGLAEGDVDGRPEVWSCGVPFLVIPLASTAALARATLDLTLWRRTLAATEAHKVYPIARRDASTWDVRMFAPLLNVPEDAATGGAAAALAGWLAQRETGDGTRRCTLRQGDAIGRASRLELEYDVVGGAVSAVRVGGSAVFVAEGELRL